jgi:hypothetical protein
MTTTKFLRTMMGIPTDRARKYMKLLRRMIKKEHLYSTEKLIEMKQQLRILEEELEDLEKRVSKGFGK